MAARGARIKLMVMATFTLGFLVADASGAGVTYTYDPVGRVGTGLYDNNLCIAYTYDAAGNRASQTSASTASPVWGAVPWGCSSWTP